MKTHNKIYNLTTTLLLVVMMVVSALASSHREAPLISNDPLADNVDLYAFRSPDNPDMISIIATYVPFQLPHGGPNYYSFGENVRYEIHVDNNPAISGDEITYRFTFKIINEDPTTFFYIRLGAQNQKTTYNLERSTDGGKTFQMIIQDGIVPPNNIGPRSIQSAAGLNTTYDALWNNAITTASTGERVFAGPSDDPFFVDLGGIFDLGDAPRQNGTPSDGVACYNVSTIAIQVPISALLKTGAPLQPTNILDSDYVIGVWASASRPAITTLSSEADPTYSGDWIQVSRLGMPLTNEAVIAIGDKDYWNSITPYDEISETTLDEYFYNPELALYMDDDLFGAAVPAMAPLRIQTNSLGAFDFTNGADGLFSLKGSAAVAGTALDDAVFGTLLLPGPGKPRSVDLWPAFHTGVPNVIPYQLATGKGGNPLAAGKPFVNNFLPNGGDMLRLNMAVPVTSRTDPSFSSLGLIQAAALGLTVAPYNTTADLEFIPNMDGFPNGRRLEDDVTRIELQAVSGVVLAAIGLWYDDYDPATSASPVTKDLLDVLTYSTGVEANDRPFTNSFPHVAQPFSGTGDCSGQVIKEMVDNGEIVSQVYVSSNTTATIGVYGITDANTIVKSTLKSEATDGDGIFYDPSTDVLYQLNRSQNVINAYSNVSSTPTLTATSTSDFSNGREIAVSGNKLIVAQDASDTNDGNKFFTYTISPTSIVLDKIQSTDINLWGIHLDGGILYAVVDNSNTVAEFDDFLMNSAEKVLPTRVISVDGLIRTHGITFDASSGTMFLTDVGDGTVADDGAFIVVDNWVSAKSDGTITMDEQVRVEGTSTFLGNPVDIAFDKANNRIYIAERANDGGRVLAFNKPAQSANVSPDYNDNFAGASAIFFSTKGENVTVCDAVGGTLATQDGMTEITDCLDDAIEVVRVVLTGNVGATSAWVITDGEQNILGLPAGPEFTFNGLGVGTYNLYNLSYTGDIGLLDVGGNINNLTGCFKLSNPIVITNLATSTCTAQVYTATLTGTQEVIPALTMASGQISASLTADQLIITGSFENLRGDFDASIAGGSHIHMASAGRAGGIVFSLKANVSSDLRSGTYSAADNTFTLTADQVEAFKNRQFYVNIHTKAYGSGELRGQLLPASEHIFQTNLVGSNQQPQVVTSATGGVLFELNGNTITVSGSFKGLSSNIATQIAGGAHIHHAPAGRAGEVVRVLDLKIDADNKGAVIEASKNTFVLTDEELGWLNFNALYINVHSDTYNSGEIRGQMTPLSLASFRANLVGVQQSPAVNTDANGMVLLNYNTDGKISVSGSFNQLGTDLATNIAGGAHLHLNVAGLAGPVITPITATVDMTNKSGIFFPANNQFTLSQEQIQALFDRGIYVNIHSAQYASGEIRGQALPIAQAYFATNLAGLNETTPAISSASGNVQLEWNAGKITVSGGFSGLSGDFDANVAGGSHIHMAEAGNNGGIVITLVPVLDANKKGGRFLASANSFDIDAALASAVSSGGTYINIHTTAYPGGELRGQILSDDNKFPGASTISTPSNGTSVAIDGDSTDPVQISWASVTDPDNDKVVYIWQLLADNSGDEILFQTNTGATTSFSPSQATIDGLLAEAGIGDGKSVTLLHRVVSSDGSVNTFSEVSSVIFSRTADIILEGCHVPQNVVVQKRNARTYVVRWDRVNDARGYEIMIGFAGVPRSFSTIPVRRNRITITGPADRTIEFKVRSVCSFGETSEYTVPVLLGNDKAAIAGNRSGSTEKISVSEDLVSGEYTVSPNPTNEYFNLQYKVSGNNTDLQLYDMKGQRVYQTRLSDNSQIHSIDMSQLSDGIYMLSVTVDGQSEIREKIVKTSR